VRSPISGLATLVALCVFAAATVLATTSVTIKRGDTLSSIARANGVTVAELIEWNSLDNPDLIIAGRALIVSPPVLANESEAAHPSDEVHVVTAGETLSLIARRYGASVAALVTANDLADPDRIRVGQSLKLGAPVAPSPSASESRYQIRPGDTLFSIAIKFGVSVDQLVANNSLASADHIRAGDELNVVATSPTVDPPEPDPDPPTIPARVPATPDGERSLAEAFEHWASSYSVPQDLLEALAWKESDWQPSVTSANGELGITQLSPATVVFIQENLLGFELNPLGVSDGVQLGARYLRFLIDRTGTEREALAAWVQGLWSFEHNGITASGARFADEVLEIRRTAS